MKYIFLLLFLSGCSSINQFENNSRAVREQRILQLVEDVNVPKSEYGYQTKIYQNILIYQTIKR